ncbi:S8 family serine peptidase [Legionella sp. CNM-1927-20]|uniref:S8 family serine peptidase n=1 Tax=Legionella sp. CNM-1927-20 TaxID=3422221 RepID=UPI00403B29B2
MISYKKTLIGLALLSIGQAAAAGQEEVRIIIKYKNPNSVRFTTKESASKLLNVPINSVTPIAGGAYTITIKRNAVASLTTADSIDDFIMTLRRNPAVLYAVKDRIGYFKPLPVIKAPEVGESLSHELQWDEFKAPGGVMLESAAGLRDGAWSLTTGNATPPIVVAVLDTGIALNPHLSKSLIKDKKGKVWGWNFAGNNQNLADETQSYHGTHVAGTIAASGNVMLGVGEHLKILPVKIPDGSGMFYESQVINAIYWAVGGDVPGAPSNPYPAKVLNMSFGVDERPGKEIDHCDEALQEALTFAREKGAVLTVAAGNDNQWEHYNAPAVCNSAIKVASVGPEGLRAYYSNYGPGISFAAPGGDVRYGKTTGGILSTVNPGGGYFGSGFDFYQGTSMAAPHAAGVAGLIYSINNNISPEKLETILYATTHGFGQSNDANKSCVDTKPCGHGILDAFNAVKTAIANYDIIFTAPSSKDLPLKACQNGYQSANSTLQTPLVHWQLTKSSCQSRENYQQVNLEKKNNEIVVHYGATEFSLDTSSFRQCDIIGAAGIGCYQ